MDSIPAGRLPSIGALIDARASTSQPWEPGYRVTGFDDKYLKLAAPNTGHHLSKRISGRNRTWRHIA